MKFHVTKDKNLNPVDFWLEVERPVRRTSGYGRACQCSKVYPVVNKSIKMDAIEAGFKCTGHLFVCVCHGEVVRVGRPLDSRREEYRERFQLSRTQRREQLTQSLMDKLDQCKDDDARRILLGVKNVDAD